MNLETFLTQKQILVNQQNQDLIKIDNEIISLQKELLVSYGIKNIVISKQIEILTDLRAKRIKIYEVEMQLFLSTHRIDN